MDPLHRFYLFTFVIFLAVVPASAQYADTTGELYFDKDYSIYENGTLSVELELFAKGIDSPTAIKSAYLLPLNETVLFVTGQHGYVYYILNNGSVYLFLNISTYIHQLEADYDERGLLGIAFHPYFSKNGRFFLWYNTNDTGTQKAPLGCHCNKTMWDSIVRLQEWHYDWKTGYITPVHVLLQFKKPFSNHNGVNNIEFNPLNGFLYLATGDGGCAYDPFENAQNTNKLLGKLLKIDVKKESGSEQPKCEYVLHNGTFEELYQYCPEMYKNVEIVALGIRNPGGLSFEVDHSKREAKAFFVDAGQNRAEELNMLHLPSSRPLNLGWDWIEGYLCVNQSLDRCPSSTMKKNLCTSSASNETIPPLAVGFHDDKRIGDPLSVFIGGHLYKAYHGRKEIDVKELSRKPSKSNYSTYIPCLDNMYVFGAYSSGGGAPNLYAVDAGCRFTQQRRPAYINVLNYYCRYCPSNIYFKTIGTNAYESVIYIGASVSGGPGTSYDSFILRLSKADCPAKYLETM